MPYYKNARVITGKLKKPKSICFETEGDTNKYFDNPRLLDEYLPLFENRWNNNISKLENGVLDQDAKYELSGYIAFLRSCSPTAKRLGQKTIADAIEPIAYKIGSESLDKAGYLNDEHKLSLCNAFQKREMEAEIEVAREFAHAQGIRALLSMLYRYYCSRWKVFINKTNIPFITSDNPAIQYRHDIHQQMPHTYVPLKPSMALLIVLDSDIARPDFEDVKRYDINDSMGVVKRSDINRFNEALVKSAERIVLHQKREDWLIQLVRQFSKWRVESVPRHLTTDSGTTTITGQWPIEIKD